jgi:ABC-type enterochelin transport system permease subunit
MVLILVGINVFFYKQNVQKMGNWAPFLVVLISVVLILLSMRLIKHTPLPTKIVVGLLLGVVVGILFRDQAVFLRPIGTIFVRLIS